MNQIKTLACLPEGGNLVDIRCSNSVFTRSPHGVDDPYEQVYKVNLEICDPQSKFSRSLKLEDFKNGMFSVEARNDGGGATAMFR